MKKITLFKKIILNFKIHIIFKPFLKRKHDQLLDFKNIDENIPLKIEEILNELKKYSETYKVNLYNFETIILKIKNHNREVEKLSNYKFNINYDIFIKDPLKFNEDEIMNYFKIAQEIKKYKNIEDSLEKQCNQIIKIVENYVNIVRQFELYKKYKSLTLLKDDFYDYETKNEVKSELIKIKNELSGSKKIYDFFLIEEKSFNEFIKNHNKTYVEKHLQDTIFDNVNNKKLDLEQRRSILCDEKANLVIAGAGSGKTLTICGKVKYILEQGIKPDEILILSYSKKSALDLENKVKDIDKRLKVGTFHKIGLEILEEKNKNKIMVEDQFDFIIENFFKTEIFKNSKVLKNVFTFYAFFLKTDKNVKFNDEGELFHNLKNQDYTTLKSTLSYNDDFKNNLLTIKKEKVKSLQELLIANFYFVNGIKYSYEKPYKYKVSTNKYRQYTPDFYLDDFGIYHEHYGIDKNGRATQFSGIEEKNYLEGIKWKREIHNKYQTKYFETYSYDFYDEDIFLKLKEKLTKFGVKFNPLSKDEIMSCYNSIYKNVNFKSLITLIKTFLNLYKTRYSDSKKFEELKNLKFNNIFLQKRTRLFLNICEDIYDYYKNYLFEENKIDFDNMIQNSAICINEVKNFKYKYIIVDEFQDISFSRMEFLRALIKHGNSKLFAVGDDWQAIYRFSGCDLSIFTNFNKYFGECSTNFITTTHRNSQELQDIVGEFIRKNKEQINKSIKSDKHLINPIELVYFNNNKIDIFNDVLDKIYQMNNKANILILGRNNKDINEILNNDLYFKPSNIKEKNAKLVSKKYPTLNLKYSTVHSSKGLEDDYVILINAADDILGFPNKIEDDPIIDLILSQKDEIEFSEERRLWYVALTRTRNYCFILVNSSKPSTFVNEIKDKCEIINEEYILNDKNKIKCPSCKSGNLIIYEHKGKKFYGCSNYPYCNYTIDNLNAVEENLRCPICGDFLIKRSGKYGYFYSCHNYPSCKFKLDNKYYRKVIRKI